MRCPSSAGAGADHDTLSTLRGVRGPPVSVEQVVSEANRRLLLAVDEVRGRRPIGVSMSQAANSAWSACTENEGIDTTSARTGTSSPKMRTVAAPDSSVCPRVPGAWNPTNTTVERVLREKPRQVVQHPSARRHSRCRDDDLQSGVAVDRLRALGVAYLADAVRLERTGDVGVGADPHVSEGGAAVETKRLERHG